jgi:hypothetical protein
MADSTGSASLSGILSNIESKAHADIIAHL